MEKIEILGVKIDNLSLQEVLAKVAEFLESKNKSYIVTANPEFLVAAQKDEHFKKILNYADIAVADGVGLIFAAKLKIFLCKSCAVGFLVKACRSAIKK